VSSPTVNAVRFTDVGEAFRKTASPRLCQRPFGGFFFFFTFVVKPYEDQKDVANILHQKYGSQESNARYRWSLAQNMAPTHRRKEHTLGAF
jgi:hypothetical protein